MTSLTVGQLVTLDPHYHWSRGRVYRVVRPGQIAPSAWIVYINDKRTRPKEYLVFPEECTVV